MDFYKSVFLPQWHFFSFNALNAIPLKCVSLNNQECKIRSKIIDINSNEPLFYRCTIEISKFSGSCNSINDPYPKLCVTDVVKNMNVRVFNLMSRTNETKPLEWHKTCKNRCRLDIQVVAIQNNVGIMINVDVNAKN